MSETERVLDAFLAPEREQLADRVLEAAFAHIARTPQRRALRVPRRFHQMPILSRAASIAAVVFVAVVGGAGWIYLDSRAPSGPSGPGPSSTPAPSPTDVAPGISGWKRFTSAVYGSGYGELGYPADWSIRAPATRAWRAGDPFPADDMPYADTFVSPGKGDAQIGLIVWSVPAKSDDRVETVEGLKVWADRFCDEVLVSTSCDGFSARAVPWAWDNGNYYTSAILVKSPRVQFAFLGDCNSCLISGVTDRITVVAVGREDTFPRAARYGGTVGLLKSVLRTISARGPLPGEVSGS
jgi:hypothetical protein